MKAMLVDDNYQMLQFMENAINWQELGIELIGSFGDGEEALSKASSVAPDLLITDIDMPKMNGLELIEQIQKEYDHVQTLIISCHDDFAYAQKAVRLFVCDYLLKDTLEPEAFKEAVIHLIDKWRDKQKSKQLEDRFSLAEDISPSTRDAFSMILEGKSPNAVSELEWNHYDYVPILGRASTSLMSVSELNSFGNKRFTTYGHSESFLLNESSVMWFIAIPIKRHRSFEITDPSETNAACFFMTDVPRSTSELIKATQRLLHSENDFFYRKKNGFIDTLALSIPFTEIHIHEKVTPDLTSIVRSLAHGKKNDLFSEVSNWINQISDHRYDCRTVKTWAFYTLERIESRAEHASGICFGSLGELSLLIHQCLHIRELQDLMVKRLLEMMDQMTHPHRQLKVEVIEAKMYVEEHIHEKIQMETVASALYLNSSYFSRVFKKETSMTFIEYVHQKKIEEACKSLIETTNRIDDISRQYGFDNTSYFIKVFKRFTNLSPNEYRKAFVSIPESS